MTEPIIKSSPILMSGPMVLATREGRKTMTRRIINPQPSYVDKDGRWYRMPSGGYSLNCYTCPYGKPGDRLWVREAFRYSLRGDESLKGYITGIDYRSDGLFKRIQFDEWQINNYDAFKVRPSIHMPRWASRINLEITDIKVERVQDISFNDILSEGVNERLNKIGRDNLKKIRPEWPLETEVRYVWACLWDTINGSGAWKRNDYVWAISYEEID